eukprot:GHVT01001029.1.p1 GENE.GHVT01001029.1~~GHVT01001029.1.p1  ORF type:complete len:170 (-),score=7.85 GHVT01001029.1:584-1093(-)
MCGIVALIECLGIRDAITLAFPELANSKPSDIAADNSANLIPEGFTSIFFAAVRWAEVRPDGLYRVNLSHLIQSSDLVPGSRPRPSPVSLLPWIRRPPWLGDDALPLGKLPPPGLPSDLVETFGRLLRDAVRRRVTFLPAPRGHKKVHCSCAHPLIFLLHNQPKPWTVF